MHPDSELLIWMFESLENEIYGSQWTREKGNDEIRNCKIGYEVPERKLEFPF